MQELTGAQFDAPTLRTVLFDYLRLRTLKPRTKALYMYIVDWGVPDWVDLPIDMISDEMILIRHKELSEGIVQHERKVKRGEGKAAADMTMRVLRTLMNYALICVKKPDKTKAITENPVLSLSALRQWNPRVKRQTVVQEVHLPDWYTAVRKVGNPTMRDYMITLLFTGSRRDECRRLIWSDVNFGTQMLTFRKCKTTATHTIPLSKFLFDFLASRYWYMNPDPDDFIFPGRFKGTPISEHWDGYQDLWEDANVEFKLHDLRRTFSTTAEALEIPPHIIKWLMNHKQSADITMTYIVMNPERLREPMEKISQRLVELCGIK